MLRSNEVLSSGGLQAAISNAQGLTTRLADTQSALTIANTTISGTLSAMQTSFNVPRLTITPFSFGLPRLQPLFNPELFSGVTAAMQQVVAGFVQLPALSHLLNDAAYATMTKPRATTVTTSPTTVVTSTPVRTPIINPDHIKLRSYLAGKHEALAQKLDGALLRLEDHGADSFSQAANSFIELVDWVFRTEAPDDAVLAWQAEHAKYTHLLHDGRPTRSLRAYYLLRNRDVNSALVKTYARTINELVDIVQASKHTLGRQDYDTLVGAKSLVIPALAFMLDL